jgi:hypothetical protein
MTDTIQVLGQYSPAANSLYTIYTVGAATSAVVSSIVVCNTNSTSVTFRISIAIAGAIDATSQYIYYDLPLLGNDTFVATVGLSLATTDQIRVQASATNVAFTISGVQVT